jgi:hypothetical protein
LRFGGQALGDVGQDGADNGTLTGPRVALSEAIMPAKIAAPCVTPAVPSPISRVIRSAASISRCAWSKAAWVHSIGGLSSDNAHFS